MKKGEGKCYGNRRRKCGIKGRERERERERGRERGKRKGEIKREI